MAHVGFEHLHRDPNFNFQLNRLLENGSPAMLAELRTVAPRIRTLRGWVSEMLGLVELAEAGGRAGDVAAYLRAAEFFMSPRDPRKRELYERFMAAFTRVSGGRPAQVQVPFEGGVLPAYEVGEATGAQPIVVHGGFDSFVEEFLGLYQALAAALGTRVIAFDGPGQGGALVRGGLPMTEAWHRPVGAVLDHFGVARCQLVGISLGGCLALRAAAFEPRVTAVVAFDVLSDFFECVVSRRGVLLVPVVRALLDWGADPLIDGLFRAAMTFDPLSEWGLEQGMHVTGAPTPAAFLRRIQAFTTADISPLVRQHVLLLAGETDHFVPLHQLEAQRRALTSAASVTTRVFTPAEQAASHCQIGNLPLALETICAWLREHA
jgi:pimeloyl-ACP methyl ester carboxylesterase